MGKTKEHSTVAMMDDKFNRDILANPGDHENLKDNYEELYDFLYWEELVSEFKESERIALEYKKRTINNGRIAVWTGFATIAIVAAYPAVSYTVEVLSYLYSSNPSLVKALSALEMFFRYSWLVGLLVSLIVGSQSLFVKKRRHTWMKSRAFAERLRQLFFQHMIVWLPYFASDNQQDKQKAIDSRSQTLATFRDRFGPSSGASTQKLIDDSEHDYWQIAQLTPLQTSIEGKINPQVAHKLLKYIFERRLEYQENHARRQLEDSRSNGFVTPSFKLARHSRMLIALGAAFLTFQFVTGLLIFMDDSSLVYSSTLTDQSPILHPTLITQTAAAVCIGLVVALRALQDGLNLRSDVSRYRTYCGLLRRIKKLIGNKNTFDESNIADIQIQLMMAEELSYWEMREFIILHSDSVFAS